ncbi:MAG: hypothetical protein C0622_11595, partial [Desulfuromonas sp.]
EDSIVSAKTILSNQKDNALIFTVADPQILRRRQITKRKRIMIYDRNLADFLCLDSKTDRPKWSKYYPLTNIFGKRTPTVHCIADFASIESRKLEITREGHRRYDEMMFEHFSRRSPTEYTLFNNNGSFETSLTALQNIVSGREYPFYGHFAEKTLTTSQESLNSTVSNPTD